MTQAVLDASVAVNWLLDGGAQQQVRRFDQLVAPSHFDAEVSNGLRRQWLAGRLADGDFVSRALRIPLLPVVRREWSHLLPRVLQLAATVSTSDAAYVAMAEELGAPLVTLDARLARASGLQCEIQVLGD